MKTLLAHDYKGYHLVAKPVPPHVCAGCFYRNDLKGCGIAPSCQMEDRDDGTDIIWKLEDSDAT